MLKQPESWIWKYTGWQERQRKTNFVTLYIIIINITESLKRERNFIIALNALRGSFFGVLSENEWEKAEDRARESEWDSMSRRRKSEGLVNGILPLTFNAVDEYKRLLYNGGVGETSANFCFCDTMVWCSLSSDYRWHGDFRKLSVVNITKL